MTITDPTAGRSAGTPRNADLDPMAPAGHRGRQGRAETASDPTAGCSAGTPRNQELDPTRARSAKN